MPGVLVAIAALHAAWALGSPRPAAGQRELAERVLSQGGRRRLDGGLPPAPLTSAVALALLAGAVIVRAVASGMPSRALRGAAWGISAVFLARGVVYIPTDLIGGLGDGFERLDLAIYSPLCLALGAGTAVVVRCTSPTGRIGEARPELAVLAVGGQGERR